MRKRVLITGGAGFIGSHLAEALLAQGWRVRALDDLTPQVHGPDRKRPAYLPADVELQVGDVRNPEAVRRALEGVEAVFHFAARDGVGQSMYEAAEYTSVNTLGTAVLLEAISKHPVEKLVVASSMSVYGEGRYSGANGALYDDIERTPGRLREGDWEPRTASGEFLTPVPTPTSKTPSLASVYALTKYDQERLCLIMGRAYHVPTVALRFFNAYGTRQALSNPYTGVLAIFASRLLNGRRPLVFEDGLQKRDFVHVSDVAEACRLALEKPEAAGRALNVGSGRPYTVREIAERLAVVTGHEGITPEITGRYRVGDIRHCFADLTETHEVLGYTPKVALETGLTELAEWLPRQVARDRVDEMAAELSQRGLTT